MDIRDRRVMVLGAYGEVGIVICKQLLAQGPKELIITSLREGEVKSAREELAGDTPEGCTIKTFYGNLFLRWDTKDMSISDLPRDSEFLRTLVDDTFSELNEPILTSSTLYRVITEHQPDIVVDCVTTASSLAYQNVYHWYEEARHELEGGSDPVHESAVIYRLLSAISIPPLIRHVQILYESMRRAGTCFYLKIGTTGTGGMGFNIPFTHGEESPSRLLMTKTAVAGAHTMLMFVLNRTPGGPAIKEIKPAAMIAWKGIGKGKILKAGHTVSLRDCPVEQAYPLEEGALFRCETVSGGGAGVITGEVLEGVYVDTGENGVFSSDEYKVVSSLGLMEFVTPEEIAKTAIETILGLSTSKDVIGAIESAVMGPTYRAGLLRGFALDRMVSLGSEGVAYGLIGPLVSKLIFEAHLLKECHCTVEALLSVKPDDLAENLDRVVSQNRALRNSAISIGMPILLSDGRRLLFAYRGVKDKGWEEKPWIVSRETIDKWASGEWIDLRTENVSRWQARLRKILDASSDVSDVSDSQHCQRAGLWERNGTGEVILDPGEVTAWVLIHEFGGGRR